MKRHHRPQTEARGAPFQKMVPKIFVTRGHREPQEETEALVETYLHGAQGVL